MAEQLPMDLRRWLIQLGKLTTNHITTDEAADWIDTVQPMIASRFPPAAFTFLSLEHVASQCKYLPTYGELAPLLGEWWREHKPKPQGLRYEPPAPRPEPTAEERAHVKWAVKQVEAMCRSSEQPEQERRQWRQMTPEQLEASGFKPRKNSHTDGHNRA